MKPTTIEINELMQLLDILHGEKLNDLKQKANNFGQFLTGLDGFRIVENSSPLPHVGRVIVDGVLQQGKDYEKAVRPAVKNIVKWTQANSLSGFADLLRQKPLIQLLGNFSKDNTKQDLLNTTEYFQAKELNTFNDLQRWLKLEENRDTFARAGKLGPFFRTADKTADYFRKLLGHSDAVAVDRGQKMLLAQAQVVKRYSTSVTYKEKRTILQLTGLKMGCRPIDMDESIYQYYVNTNKMTNLGNQIFQQFNTSKNKYCTSCGYQLFSTDKYCSRCGEKQH